MESNRIVGDFLSHVESGRWPDAGSKISTSITAQKTSRMQPRRTGLRDSEDFLPHSGHRWRGRRCFQVLFTWVDEVSRSPTYLAASKPYHNAGGPDFAHRLRRARLDRVNADAIFARWFELGFTGS